VVIGYLNRVRHRGVPRSVRAGLQSARVVPAEKHPKLPQQDLPGRLVIEQEMVPARERNDSRPRYACGKQASFMEGHDNLALAMQGDGGSVDVGEDVRAGSRAATHRRTRNADPP
jgi:hypothetical protein